MELRGPDKDIDQSLQDPDPSTPRTTRDSSVRYRECLKNHAASMGGHVVDGCGEFMPSGEESTAEALRCAACDCHRNFHRREAQTIFNSCQLNPHAGSQTQQLHSQSRGFGAMVSFGGNTGDESSSEDLNMRAPSSRKRFRTRFSQEQKDKMQELAERLGWRIKKEDEQQVQRLCSETGVKRQVFKVWMHNNKKRQIN